MLKRECTSASAVSTAGCCRSGKYCAKLLGEQHSLVDDRLVGQAREVPILGAVDRGGADLAVGALADDVELALERHVVLDRGIAADEHLTDEWFARLCRLSQRGVVGRHRAPAEDRLPFGLDDVFEDFGESAALGRVARQEHQAAGVLSRPRQRQAVLLRHLLKECVRHLDEHARAVAGIGLATTRAAMVEVAQHLDGLLHDAVGFPALHVDDEADAAGLVLEPRIVKTLLSRLPRGATREALLSAAFVLHDQFP